MMPHAGGCLRGKIRFEASGEPLSVSHCHCGFCRRQTGAAVATFASFTMPDRFAWIGGTPALYRSSPTVRRKFRPRCGTPLTFEEASRPTQIDVAISVFDRPDLLPPQAHFHTDQKIAWLHVDDHLPRFSGGEA